MFFLHEIQAMISDHFFQRQDFLVIQTTTNVWFVEYDNEWIYFVQASKAYPTFLASEILGDLRELVTFDFFDSEGSDELNMCLKSIYDSHVALEDSMNSSITEEKMKDFNELLGNKRKSMHSRHKQSW